MANHREMNEPLYILTIRALPDAVAPERRLARLLKALLRAYGFRCVHLDTKKEDDDRPADSLETD